MITCKLSGRLGNNLFQVAATMAHAKKLGVGYSIPSKTRWHSMVNTEFPEGLLPTSDILGLELYKEKEFKYNEIELKDNICLDGYFQSEKYFRDYSDDIRYSFIDMSTKAYDKIKTIPDDSVCVIVRRGDFVNNPNHFLLPVEYYFSAMIKYFPGRNFVFFSDDINYCQNHFMHFPNTYFVDGFSSFDQFTIAGWFKDFIISNSTFAWWCAWMGETEESVIIRPKYHFDGELVLSTDTSDHYPERWIEHDYKTDKIDLRDTTFIIPSKKDTQDREDNIKLNIKVLRENFNTNIIVGEQNTHDFEGIGEDKYMWFNYDYFHRTRMLNEMADHSTTEIVINWDADVFVSPVSVWLMVDALRHNADFCYPYDGRFARIPREYFEEFEKHKDVFVFFNGDWKGTRPEDMSSVGGAVGFKKSSYWKAGGENEGFISHAPEDAERFFRYQKLGFCVERVEGILYHIDHEIREDSRHNNDFRLINTSEWRKVKNMTKNELSDYVSTWKWVKKNI